MACRSATWPTIRSSSRRSPAGQLEHWRALRPEHTLETRLAKLQAHLNREGLPIAWVAHADGQPLGTAALRVHDLEGRDDLMRGLGQVCASLGTRVIAEGVETEDQKRILGLIRCDAIQGFLISRPVPLEQAIDLIKQRALSG